MTHRYRLDQRVQIREEARPLNPQAEEGA
jgi:hypothetical protein